MLLYVLSVLASAFCLFLVQPLMAKRILPLFGGAASVWAVCLLFYQTLLLGGYLYAHWLGRRPSLKQQGAIHFGLAVLSVAVLIPGATPRALGGNPQLAILAMLTLTVGLPYFLLSTTSPLMQHWYAARYPEGRAYRLFAWSNLSCAVALLAFPLALEPFWTLSAITAFWKIAFAATAVLVALTAMRTMTSPAVRRTSGDETGASRVTLRDTLPWIGYSLLGSVLLLAVTNYLCQAVAPFPFLWVAPLLLYLLTFVVAFEREAFAARVSVISGMIGLIAIAAAAKLIPPSKITDPGIFLWLIGMFCTCLYFHTALASSKPATRHLTEFYIAMATGGALGSFLVAFIATAVFPSFWELPLVMIAGGVLLFKTVDRANRAAYYTRSAMLAVTLPVAFVLISDPVADNLDVGRNFYGILSVADRTEQGRKTRVMEHGPVMHGKQFLDAAQRTEPTAYFSRISGAGKVLVQPAAARRVGIIGLGAGTLAAYGREGDHFTFYEINPMVERMARQDFTFLSDSKADVDVRIGDARLLLESEQPQRYDVFVVDAFSGDAIPVHLLTREAFALYKRHLKPGGTLLIHISNYNLDLDPVVAASCESIGFASARIDSPSDPRYSASTATWIVAGEPSTVAAIAPPRTGASAPARLWTDDFSSLLTVLRH